MEDRVRATVVTCPANVLVETLHDRMPAIIEPGDVESWVEQKDGSVLVPAGDVLTMHAVSTDVHKSTNNRSGLLAAVEVSGGKQARLY